MDKYFSPYDWSNLCVYDASTALVKYASNGLRGKDLVELRKRAGDDFAARVMKLPPPDGEEYVHVIALGSYDAYGPNRKGDAFPESVCKEYHSTFRKYARWYREHIHHDPSRSYGIVKLSYYNEKMRRIDLVVALNATKEACEKNGGLIADEELNELYSGNNIPVSMACRVSHDICSGCGNKSRTIREYCDERRCIKYGGCKRNLGKLFEDGHILCVINPDPVFFDISYVRVPADRTAFSVGLLKSGVANIELDKITIETIYKSPQEARRAFRIKQSSNDDYFLNRKLQLLQTLCDLEKKQLPNVVLKKAFADVNFSLSFDENPYNLLRRLNSSNCLMPPAMFSTFMSKIDPRFTKNASFDTSSAFQKLFSKIKLYDDLKQNKFITDVDPYMSTDEYAFWSLNPGDIYNRLFRGFEKFAGIIPPKTSVNDIELIRNYALYQLEFLMSTGVTPEKINLVITANKLWN